MPQEHADRFHSDRPKEIQQREVAYDIRGELADLTAEVASERLQSNYLEQHDYLGLLEHESVSKEQVIAAFKELSINSPDNPARLPPLVVKSLLTDYLDVHDNAANEQQFADLFEQLRDQQLSNRDYLDQVLALAAQNSHAVPANYVASYQQFQRLMSPSVVSNGHDRQVIEQKFSTLDMTFNPDPIVFLQAEVLGDPELTGVSLETQHQIREVFELPIVNSGTEIQGVLMRVNADGSARYDQKHPLPIRPGVNAYIDNSGSQILQAKVSRRASRNFDISGWSAERVTELSEYLTLYALSEQAGISSMLEACYDLDFSLGDDFDVDKQVQTRQVMEALLGFNKGYDGRIIDESDIAKLKWQLQIYSPRGDAAQGDVDIEATRQNLIELGVRDEHGQLNYDVLRAIGSYTREIYLTGEPDYFSLKKYIKRLI